MDINTILKDFLQSGHQAAKDLADDSEAIAESIGTTLQLGERAARDLAAGRLDLEGAQRSVQRGWDQLRTAARAEGNLAAASTVDWLEGTFGTLLKLIPGLPNIG